MSEMKELSVREDTATSLKAMSQALRRQATALSELGSQVGQSKDQAELFKAGLAAGVQARELQSLVAHLQVLENYLTPGD